jgi:hypothetical protein
MVFWVMWGGDELASPPTPLRFPAHRSLRLTHTEDYLPFPPLNLACLRLFRLFGVSEFWKTGSRSQNAVPFPLERRQRATVSFPSHFT